MNSEPFNPHKLINALEVFRAGGMSIDRMRDCIEAWIKGADFSTCWNDDEVFIEADKWITHA